MSIGLFTDEVIDHFSNPRNAGEMEDANGIGDAGDPGCGDTMRLYIKVEDDLIKDVSFKICGCVAALASASVTTVLVKGKTIDEALMIMPWTATLRTLWNAYLMIKSLNIIQKNGNA